MTSLQSRTALREPRVETSATNPVAPIELVARQGALSTVMTVTNWTGDPRGLKRAADAVPAREWQRQMKDMPTEQLLCLVNASSFKKARQPGMKP